MRFQFKRFRRWTNKVKAKRYGLTTAQLQKIQQERGNLPIPAVGTAEHGNRRGRKANEAGSVRSNV